MQFKTKQEATAYANNSVAGRFTQLKAYYSQQYCCWKVGVFLNTYDVD